MHCVKTTNHLQSANKLPKQLSHCALCQNNESSPVSQQVAKATVTLCTVSKQRIISSQPTSCQSNCHTVHCVKTTNHLQSANKLAEQLSHCALCQNNESSPVSQQVAKATVTLCTVSKQRIISSQPTSWQSNCHTGHCVKTTNHLQSANGEFTSKTVSSPVRR